MDLVLVDGPNLFNSVARYLEARAGEEHGKHLPQYFLEWFDFDRLVMKALGTQTPPGLGIVIFHSSKALGRGVSRLESDNGRAFWARQAGNFDTSDVIVDVPADQREHYEFTCECGKKCSATVSGEKGVDSAMIVHMFETAGRWETLAIFSRDVDFAPAVSALRRRGKQVYTVGEPGDERTALGRAAQSFFALPFGAVLQDFGLFLLCRRGGLLDQWRAEVEAGAYVSGYFWGVGEILSVLLKGDLPRPLVEQLHSRAALLPGVEFHGEVGESPRQSGISFRIPLFFRRTPPLGAWAEALVRDAREIKDPAHGHLAELVRRAAEKVGEPNTE
jgi:hypothetical protein